MDSTVRFASFSTKANVSFFVDIDPNLIFQSFFGGGGGPGGFGGFGGGPGGGFGQAPGGFTFQFG